MNKRPIEITIAGLILILAGTVGFVYHITEFNPRRPIEADFVWIEVVRLIAVLCGVYLLRGMNWARWLALAWLLFHVVVSAFHSRFELAMHAIFFAAFTVVLCHPRATRYFRPAEMQ